MDSEGVEGKSVQLGFKDDVTETVAAGLFQVQNFIHFKGFHVSICICQGHRLCKDLLEDKHAGFKR